MRGRAGEAEPLYRSLGAKPSAVRKNIFVESVLNSQRGVSASVYQNSFHANVTDLDKMLAGAKSRMDTYSLQYAKFLEAVAVAYPNFKVKNEPVIPLIETAINIRKHLDPVRAATDPNIAYDEFLIAHRIAALGGYFITPAVESYNIF